jgi:hypothetical protein
MNLKICIVLASVVALPFAANAQQKQPAAKKPTVADVQRVVKIVGSDPAKKQALCDMAKLDGQMAEAEEKKDTKKVEALSKNVDALMAKIGPEYASLMEGLDEVDPASAEGKQIASAIEGFDKLCPGGR